MCIHKCPDDPNNVCDYKPVPRDDDYKRVCNYEEFEKALKKFNRRCFNANVQGTFSNCTSLLKDSYDTAIECCSAVNSTTTPPTTTKVRISERDYGMVRLIFKFSPELRCRLAETEEIQRLQVLESELVMRFFN